MGEEAGVAEEGCGVAGDVDDGEAGGGEGGHLGEGTRPGGVQDDGGGAFQVDCLEGLAGQVALGRFDAGVVCGAEGFYGVEVAFEGLDAGAGGEGVGEGADAGEEFDDAGFGGECGEGGEDCGLDRGFSFQ